MKVALCLAVCLCSVSIVLAQDGGPGVLVGDFRMGSYSTSGTVRFLSATQILVQEFSYSGGAPAVEFYAYTPGTTPNPRTSTGFVIGPRLTTSLSNVEITLDLTSGRTVCDIGTLTVWCALASLTFTDLTVPSTVATVDASGNCILQGPTTPGTVMTTPTTATTPPPVTNGTGPTVPTSPPPNMTSPTRATTPTTTDTPSPTTVTVAPEDNCIPLHESFQLSWTLLPESNEARFTLCGCQSLIPGVNRYLGFGLSGSPARTTMFRADPVITWVDQTTCQPNAVDYFLSDYVQCREGVGACPDTLIAGRQCSDNVRDVSGSIIDGVQCVTFTRSFDGSDECDKSFSLDANAENFIVWAFGELGETAFKHGDFSRATGQDPAIVFGREPRNDCQGPPTCSSCSPFNPNQIVARDDTSFLAEIGPSASDRGYVAATGQAGWGIAWYIDGELAPELVVERGKTYTFTIYGGNVESNPSEYHPFYISDSLMGGRLLFSSEQQAAEVVYAGFDSLGTTATAAGALCQYMETDRSRGLLKNCSSYRDYIEALERRCNAGEPATLVFTPTESTPDILYYQCAFHLSLGWRIRVLNEGDPVPALPTFAPLEESNPATCVPLQLGAPSLAFFRLPAITISFLSLLVLALA